MFVVVVGGGAAAASGRQQVIVRSRKFAHHPDVRSVQGGDSVSVPVVAPVQQRSFNSLLLQQQGQARTGSSGASVYTLSNPSLLRVGRYRDASQRERCRYYLRRDTFQQVHVVAVVCQAADLRQRGEMRGKIVHRTQHSTATTAAAAAADIGDTTDNAGRWRQSRTAYHFPQQRYIASDAQVVAYRGEEGQFVERIPVDWLVGVVVRRSTEKGLRRRSTHDITSADLCSRHTYAHHRECLSAFY